MLFVRDFKWTLQTPSIVLYSKNDVKYFIINLFGYKAASQFLPFWKEPFSKMSNSDYPDEVAQIISNIIDEQLKSIQTNSSEVQLLLEEQKIDEVFLKSILPIYKALKALRIDNKIDAEEFNTRLDSLMNILHLLEELTDQKKN